MMKDKRRTYTIAGRRLYPEELKALALEKVSVLGTPAWEREMWSFILQWFDNTDSISVKTSGSTGPPGEIRLLKKHMARSAEATLNFFRLQQGEKAWLCLPVRYIAGKMMIVRALVGGLDLRFTEPAAKPDPGEIYGIRFAAMTPMQAYGLLETDEGKKRLERIEKLILGGGSVPVSLEKRLQDVATQVWQTYGMTETITHIGLRSVNGPSRSAWYKPLPGVSVHTRDDDRLVIDYPNLEIQGLVTGDLAVVDDKGRFSILGRIDNVVNSGGIKLFPEELERRIEDIVPVPFFLAGVEDELLGEKLVLLLEGEAMSEASLRDLKKKVLEELTGPEKPLQFFLIPAFERTGNGKLRRRQTLDLLKYPSASVKEF